MTMEKQRIDQQHLDQANRLEAQYFTIIDEGLPSQHRTLKPGKTNQAFTFAHNQIWRHHDDQLVAAGYLPPLPLPKPEMDIEAEFDKIKARLALLE